MGQRGMVGIFVVLVAIGVAIAIMPFRYHDVSCDGPAWSAWTIVVMPAATAGLQKELGICGPTARARLSVAGLVGGIGIGVGLTVLVLRGNRKGKLE